MIATLAATAPNAVLDTLLDDSRRFSVEFGPTLANHLPMVMVALAGLGASDRRLRQYYAFYRDTNRLRPPPADGRRIDAGNWREHRGDRRLEGDYRGFFTAEVRRRGAGDRRSGGGTDPARRPCRTAGGQAGKRPAVACHARGRPRPALRAGD